MIENFFVGAEASVVHGSYEGVVFNKSGMCMEMVGPGDRMRLMEICRKIVIKNKTNSDKDRDRDVSLQHHNRCKCDATIS